MTAMCLLLVLVAQNQDQDARDKERRPDRVLEWNEHALEAIRRDRTSPPVAARNLALVHLAIADSANAIYQTHKAYLVDLRATEDVDPHVAVSVAAHRVLVSLYPRQRDRLDVILNRYLDTVARGTPKSRGVTLGRYVADKMLAARREDLSEKEVTYRPSEAIGLWRPTPPRRPCVGPC